MSDINLIMNSYHTGEEWLHEILSFVILLCSKGNGGKTVIYRNRDGIYATDFGCGEVKFGNSKNLYSAFEWFHSKIGKHHMDFTEVWNNHRNVGFGHIISRTNKYLKTKTMLEMPIVCIKEHALSSIPVATVLEMPAVRKKHAWTFDPIKPRDFYMLFMRACDMYKQDLYMLDLEKDIKNQRKGEERVKMTLTMS